MHMVTADISEQKSVLKQSKRTKTEEISSTSSTGGYPSSKNYPEAVNMPQKKENVRNHPFAVKWNMFLQL